MDAGKPAGKPGDATFSVTSIIERAMVQHEPENVSRVAQTPIYMSASLPFIGRKLCAEAE
jgi:hypothetical protein